jgi:hypothetical protein
VSGCHGNNAAAGFAGPLAAAGQNDNIASEPGGGDTLHPGSCDDGPGGSRADAIAFSRASNVPSATLLYEDTVVNLIKYAELLSLCQSPYQLSNKH